VRNIGVSPDDEAILEATVNMAKRMGHELVAEGVETEAQREYLADKGCQYFQGFLFCRPLPADESKAVFPGSDQALRGQMGGFFAKAFLPCKKRFLWPV